MVAYLKCCIKLKKKICPKRLRSYFCFGVDTIQDRLEFYKSPDPEIFLVNHIWLSRVKLSFRILLAHDLNDLRDRVVLCLRCLIISDIRMPQMNGFEFIKKIKEIKPEVKVFFMTAFEINDIEFRRVLPSTRIDEFIQKPVSLEKLNTLIQNHTNTVRKQTSNAT